MTEVRQGVRPPEAASNHHIQITLLRQDELYKAGRNLVVGARNTIQKTTIASGDISTRTQTDLRHTWENNARSSRFETYVEVSSQSQTQLRSHVEDLRTRFAALGYEIADDMVDNAQSTILTRGGYRYRLVIGEEKATDTTHSTLVTLTALEHDNYPEDEHYGNKHEVYLEEGANFDRHIHETTETVGTLLEGIFAVTQGSVPQGELVFTPRPGPQKSIVPETSSTYIAEGKMLTVDEAQITRARQGVEEINTLLGNLAAEPELQTQVKEVFFKPAYTNDLALPGEEVSHPNQDLQAIFLGVKPMAILDYADMELLQQLAAKGLLPSRIKVLPTAEGAQTGVVYDSDQVKNLVGESKYAQYFPRFNIYEGDIDAYVRSIVESETFATFGGTKEAQIQTGLLLGFQFDDIDAFAHYQTGEGVQFAHSVVDAVSEVLMGRQRDEMKRDNPDLLLMLDYVGRGPQENTTEREHAEFLLDTNGRDFARYVRGLCIKLAEEKHTPVPTIEWLQYWINRRPINGYGVQFVGTSIKSLQFLAEREEVFAQSGISSVIGGEIPHTARNAFFKAHSSAQETSNTREVSPSPNDSAEKTHVLNDILEEALGQTQNPILYNPSSVFPWIRYRETHDGQLPGNPQFSVYQEQNDTLEEMMSCTLHGGDPIRDVLPFARSENLDDRARRELAQIYSSLIDVVFSGQPLEVRWEDSAKRGILQILRNPTDNSLIAIRQSFTDEDTLEAVSIVHARNLGDGKYQQTQVIYSSKNRSVTANRVVSGIFSPSRTNATAEDDMENSTYRVVYNDGSTITNYLGRGDILEEISLDDLNQALGALRMGLPDRKLVEEIVCTSTGDTLLRHRFMSHTLPAKEEV